MPRGTNGADRETLCSDRRTIDATRGTTAGNGEVRMRTGSQWKRGRGVRNCLKSSTTEITTIRCFDTGRCYISTVAGGRQPRRCARTEPDARC